MPECEPSRHFSSVIIHHQCEGDHIRISFSAAALFAVDLAVEDHVILMFFDPLPAFAAAGIFRKFDF